MSCDDVGPNMSVESFARLDPAHLWVLGIGIDDGGMMFGPGLGAVLELGECECPEDYRHDHEHE